LGTLAVVPVGSTVSPLGLLPPIWWLAVSALGALAIAHAISDHTVALLFLPFVSVVPWLGVTAPVFLIWTGPLIALIWIAVVAGVGYDLLVSRAGAMMARLDRTAAAFALALVTLGGFAAVTRLPLTGDEPHYLVISGSVLRDGDVELANDYDEERYREFYQGSLEPRHTKYTPTGHHYPIHGLGTSLLVAPAFAVAGTAGARATILVITAFGAAVLWNTVRRTTGLASAAWVGLAVLVLQVPFATQSSSIYPDPVAAAVTCFSLWMLCRVERNERVAIAEFAIFGLALSTLPWLHIRLSVIAAAFGAAVVLLALRRRIDANQLAWFLVLPIVGAALWMASSYVMFESPNPLVSLRHAGAFTSVPTSIAGLLTDQEFGLLPFAPAIAFAVLGLWDRSQPVTSLAGVAALLGTVLTTASHDWFGGTNSPSRFLVPVLPILALGVGHWWQRAGETLRRVCLMCLAIGAMFLVEGAVAGGGRYLVNVPDGRYSLFAWFSDTVDVAALLPSFFKPGNTPSTEALIAAVWAFAAITIVVALTIAGRKRPCQWTTVVGSAVLWIVIASVLSVAITGRQTITPDRSQFALLAASPSPSLPTGIAHLRLTNRDALLQRLSFRLPTEDTLTMVRIPQFPAGRYQLEFAAAPVTPSSVTLHMGRSAESIVELAVHEELSDIFALSAPLRTIVVTTADYSSASEAPVRVHPLGLLPTSDPFLEPAQHVKRYGTLVVYALDRLASLETDGFWLWGGRQTSVVIATLEGATPPMTLSFRAGNAPIDVRLARGDWQFSASLAARQSATAAAPSSDVITPFTIDVGGRRTAQAVWVTLARQ
jgi:hypothetical protein